MTLRISSLQGRLIILVCFVSFSYIWTRFTCNCRILFIHFTVFYLPCFLLKSWFSTFLWRPCGRCNDLYNVSHFKIQNSLQFCYTNKQYKFCVISVNLLTFSFYPLATLFSHDLITSTI